MIPRKEKKLQKTPKKEEASSDARKSRESESRTLLVEETQGKTQARFSSEEGRSKGLKRKNFQA